MGISPPIQLATIGMGDSLLLLVLALVVFGPRRLPMIGRQLGKLMYEFRKASNDFKFQMEEELRNAEEADRRKREEGERQRALTEAQTAVAQAQTAVAQAQTAAQQAANAAAQAQNAAQTAQSVADAQPFDAASGAAAADTAAVRAGDVEAAELYASAPAEPAAPGASDAKPPETGIRVQPPLTGEQVKANRPGRARTEAITAEPAGAPSSQTASASETAPAIAAAEIPAHSAILTEADGEARSTEPTAQHG